jgi:hypothetical protein
MKRNGSRAGPCAAVRRSAGQHRGFSVSRRSRCTRTRTGDTSDKALTNGCGASTLLSIMSLSRREAKSRQAAVTFDTGVLGAALRDGCPEVDFALLLGSARDGHIPPGGDLDLAVNPKGGLTLALVGRITAVAQLLAPGCDVDVGCFNRAEPVYRFEALRGRLLFARDRGRFWDAFSLACREYESQMRDYERQARYRLERNEVAA